jgi:hypothetical protein
VRFAADDIWKVRLGEKTRLTLPYENRPAPFKEAGYYVLERDVDKVRRSPCKVCTDGKTQRGNDCKRCGGYGERVYYTTRTERVEGEERIQVHSVQKVHPLDITDDQALEEGWESAEEWRDAFFATHGESEWVWTYTFELTKQVPQYMALQHGIVNPEQYVSTPDRAIEVADAPTADQYRGWAEQAESQRKRDREIERLEDRRRALGEKIDQLRKKAA